MENKVSLILILMAGASLVSMLGTLRIDSIINHTLYNYGLQFSTKWAIPYWTTAAVVFSMGWLIIIIAAAFELNMLIHKWHKRPKPETPQVLQEPAQKETPRTEPKPSEKPEKEEVKTTALALKTEDELSQFRVLLEEISEMTSATVSPQKADDKPKNGEASQ
jgi:hypothetical protein